MKNLTIIVLLAFIGLSANVPNDTKIGYVYMEQVMQAMPEAQEMMAIMNRFSVKRQALVEKRTAQIEQKREAFLKKAEREEFTSAGKIIAENELLASNKELEQLKERIEQEARLKRSELLAPVAKKLEKAMDEVAEQLGYRYVLNSADGTGNSIIIVAPAADDLTQKVMTHLGIELK